jgi:hypothetical protein
LSFYEGVEVGDLKIEELELEVLCTNSTAVVPLSKNIVSNRCEADQHAIKIYRGNKVL